MKWYPTDWRADSELRMCSLAARGLWIELLGCMHEADPYGHLLVNGKPPSEAKLAVLVGSDVKTLRACIAELTENGVPSFTEAGVMFSRRMVRDADKAKFDANNGALGGNPRVMAGVNPHVNPRVKTGDKAQIPEARSQIPEKSKAKTARKRATPMPAGFEISDRVMAWAADKGYTRLPERFEQFVGYVRRKDAHYVDWDEAFMSAVREDWAKLNRPALVTKSDRMAETREAMFGNALREVKRESPDDSIDGESVRVA
jgi:hypothetical protein